MTEEDGRSRGMDLEIVGLLVTEEVSALPLLEEIQARHFSQK